MQNQSTCPICGSTATTAIQITERQTYKNFESEVDLHLRHCESCESDYAGLEEAKMNKRAMLAHKRRAEGLLSSRRIKEIRAKLNLTVQQAGAVFGGGPIAFWKYEHDEVLQAASMDKLLRVAERHPEVYRTLLADMGPQILETHNISSVENPQNNVEVATDDIDLSQYEYKPRIFRDTKTKATINAK